MRLLLLAASALLGGAPATQTIAGTITANSGTWITVASADRTLTCVVTDAKGATALLQWGTGVRAGMACKRGNGRLVLTKARPALDEGADHDRADQDDERAHAHHDRADAHHDRADEDDAHDDRADPASAEGRDRHRRRPALRRRRRPAGLRRPGAHVRDHAGGGLAACSREALAWRARRDRLPARRDALRAVRRHIARLRAATSRSSASARCTVTRIAPGEGRTASPSSSSAS